MGIFIIYAHAEFHILTFSGSLIIFLKQKVAFRRREAVTSIYSVQKHQVPQQKLNVLMR
jgi:hypothetical protein